jgi:hypothetical protein
LFFVTELLPLSRRINQLSGCEVDVVFSQKITILSMKNSSFDKAKGLANANTWQARPLETLLAGAFTSLIQRPFRPNFRLFATRSYKPMTIFFLSSLVLALCYLKSGQDIAALIRTAVGAGIGCILLSIFISREWKSATRSASVRAVAKLSPDRAVTHVGSLMIGILGLLFVYAKFHSQFMWSVYPTLSLLGGFALGFSGVMLLMHAFATEGGQAFASLSSQKQEARTSLQTAAMPERLDVLAGAVVASMILGTTLVEIDSFKEYSLPAGVVWMPAVLAWCGICASLVTAKVLKNFMLGLPPAIGRMMNIFVMTIVAYLLVDGMLPSYWVIEGREKLSSEIFLAVEIGIIGGFVLLEVGNAYAWLRTRYYAWTFKRFDREAWYFKPFRHAFRIVCLVVPVLLVAVFLTYAYDHVGLYGILVAAVAMLSNLNAQLSFGKKSVLTDLTDQVVPRHYNNRGEKKSVFALPKIGLRYKNAFSPRRNFSIDRCKSAYLMWKTDLTFNFNSRYRPSFARWLRVREPIGS